MDAILKSMAVEALLPIAGTLVTALVSWAMVELSRYVRQKTKNEVAVNAVDRLCHTVTTAVAELEQTGVPALKEKIADGKLDKVDRMRLKATARRLVKERLVPSLQKDAQLVIADLDGFLNGKIEQAVLELGGK